MMPPTAWMPNTSSESSYFILALSQTTAQRQTAPATMPMTIAPNGPAKPAAGVTATRPATAPEAAPSRLAWPRVQYSSRLQVSAAAAVATMVLSTAIAA